eukprot:1188063-Prorocentrum_minimum.AAC.3
MALLRFVQEDMDLTGEPAYDLKYALRLCLQTRRHRVCVHLYSTLGMYEEAVSLALQVRQAS